jgi:hypothetical protein
LLAITRTGAIGFRSSLNASARNESHIHTTASTVVAGDEPAKAAKGQESESHTSKWDWYFS